MNNKIDSDKIKLWRKERHWSQEQAAEETGLSLRTIQRLENGGAASYESAASLANAFQVDVNDFLMEDGPCEKSGARKQSKELMGLKLSFAIHAMGFVIGMMTLLFIDWVDKPSQWTLIWPIGFWCIGFMAHGATVLLVEFVEKMKREMSHLESTN